MTLEEIRREQARGVAELTDRRAASRDRLAEIFETDAQAIERGIAWCESGRGHYGAGKFWLQLLRQGRTKVVEAIRTADPNGYLVLSPIPFKVLTGEIGLGPR